MPNKYNIPDQISKTCKWPLTKIDPLGDFKRRISAPNASTSFRVRPLAVRVPAEAVLELAAPRDRIESADNDPLTFKSEGKLTYCGGANSFGILDSF